MGIFNFGKRKKQTSYQNQLMVKFAEFLFGGIEQMNSQVEELYEIFGHRYTRGQIASVLTLTTSRFKRSEDKSAEAIVDQGLMASSTNCFKSREEAMTLYEYVAKKSFQMAFENAPDALIEGLFKGLGNCEDGATTDVIPGAYGEYGYTVTNPIPTRGIPANEVYLRKLALLSGESFHWRRIGSFAAPNIDHPIDGYEIITDGGETLCTIYISPYQRVISNLAPRGFYIKND